jgi:hypothetical protein
MATIFHDIYIYIYHRIRSTIPHQSTNREKMSAMFGFRADGRRVAQEDAILALAPYLMPEHGDQYLDGGGLPRAVLLYAPSPPFAMLGASYGYSIGEG